MWYIICYVEWIFFFSYLLGIYDGCKSEIYMMLYDINLLCIMDVVCYIVWYVYYNLMCWMIKCELVRLYLKCI